jgi:hypothetical protein
MASVYASNIVINSGADFYQTFSLEDVDTNSLLNLDGYSVNAQLRKWSGSLTSISFNCAITPVGGTVSIALSAEATSSIKPGRYVYDVLIEDPYGKRSRVVEGMVLVREGVTRV